MGLKRMLSNFGYVAMSLGLDLKTLLHLQPSDDSPPSSNLITKQDLNHHENFDRSLRSSYLIAKHGLKCHNRCQNYSNLLKSHQS